MTEKPLEWQTGSPNSDNARNFANTGSDEQTGNYQSLSFLHQRARWKFSKATVPALKKSDHRVVVVIPARYSLEFKEIFLPLIYKFISI